MGEQVPCPTCGKVTYPFLHSCPGVRQSAPEPREDVAEVLAEWLSWTSGEMTRYSPAAHEDHNRWSWRGDGHGDAIHEQFRQQAEALAPLIAERERAAVERARDESAVAEVGLADAEWTRLRHAAGNRGDLGPIAEEVERILGERVAKAWDEGHRAYRRLGPDGCKCGAYSEGECGCGKYGTNIITVNPYRADRRAER